MPRALITGATGLLGRAITTAFNDAGYETTGTGFKRASGSILRLDIQDETAVQKVFEEINCTQSPAAAHRLNVAATATIARLCAEHNAILIYISTDYVFSGKKGEAPYLPTSTPGPTNVYGQTKLDGEQAVLKQEYGSRHGPQGGSAKGIVLRVPVLYGATEPRDNNAESAVNVLLDALWKSQKGAGEKVKMDDWAIRYPTNVADVARVVVDIAAAATGPGGANVPQILQFSSEDRMTKYEIVKVLAEIMDLPVDGVVPDREGGKPGPDGTVRPYDCHLDTGELKKLGISVDTVDFVAWWRRWVGAFRH